jgi:short-subunit dehydrogenase
MPTDLVDKTIIITGASSGIGEATALACAGAGMNVVLTARREDRLQGVKARIEELGRGAEVVVGDVVETGIHARTLDAAESRFGGFHAVFANAGYGMDVHAVEMTATQLRDMFDVNFFASVDLVREAAQRLVAAERPGHMLMCSSCLAKFTLAGHSAYSATKAAQNHICRAMGVELAPRSIHVSSVHPITTTTEFFEASRRYDGRPGGNGLPDHARGAFVQPPERVARAVVKCLRKPHPEVWTSHTVRAVAAAMTLFPRLMDVAMRKA